MANRFVLNETSYHGKGAIESIPEEAKARGFKKALVCSDPDLVKFGVTAKVTDLLSVSQDTISLESPTGDEEDSTLGDFIKDDSIKGPEDVFKSEALKDQIDKVLKELPEREEAIVRMRFGLDGTGTVKTLDEVGKIYGITKERVRQIENKAMRRLKMIIKTKEEYTDLDEE